ncbi:ABC transporter ATP-binding protein [bacterium M00.F.Ca.ET.228.01.1.1]|uniref:ABC transporter ATP-binding protein n=1 Tax=Paraburkholderia phenoliruptrix TaxID=252970 RepID=UPI0010933546|nr:ABC transporter ATP-binding protein [Paraburkholderia phenoliruptrix]TGP41141.1 ABC transporter ATP-binding protein [bacterium M00.F.Ca.ET.228.01.1.1]TGR97567.1 ABC transporter ATP-binding protein [bacterium M00.F.Ca.ET.191.01.1.1]TGU09224.1 ABC transporter ATP-binding protein [bacterium M00.F.Ca.ET.155.01.1.1]MBW0450415.1 ABC transporter ATP-binding protein [Paraburkholderia phenoliruptrix]MBW9101037.1 ABC transporter ATP-binding protein [Paraburkholderia phenoliruptrix]
MTPLLHIRGLNAWYGPSQALHGVNLRIDAGEVLALVGRNGSGRSTLARAIMGLVQCEGELRLAGRSLAALRTFEIARLGIGYVPEHRDVFAGLSVGENLELGVAPRRRESRAGQSARFTVDDAYTLFPVLRERKRTRAGVLSGGEQQMLALARALLGDPDLLVVDEPGEGLASAVMQHVAQCLRVLRERGMAMLLIEQRLVIARDLASRVAVMGHGEIVFDGELDAFQQRTDVMREWLGVG